MPYIYVLVLILVTNLALAQDKIEIEKRVKDNEVPINAIKGLSDILDSDHNIRWFYQEDGNKKVFEAKFELQTLSYSVEFNTEGIIYNVEIELNDESLEPKFVNKLNKTLDRLFDRTIIRKIQIEYLGKEEDLFELIAEGNIDDDLTKQFEVELKGRSGKKINLYELILNDKVKLISKRKIKLKSTDILDY